MNAGLKAEVVAAGLHGHHDFFKRAVARAFAQAVNRAFDLTRSALLDAGQGIGHRHTEVVVAVHGPDGLIGIGNVLAEVSDKGTVTFGHGVTHRIGNIDGRGTGVNHGFADAVEKFRIRAVAVFSGKFNVVGVLGAGPHGGHGALKHFVRRHAQFCLHVQGRRCNKGVNTAARRRGNRFTGAFNVLD